MKIIHMHYDGGIDASSPITIDPEKLADEQVPERMLAGVIARYDAVHEGKCPVCNQGPTMLNRAQRRKMWPRRKAQFQGFVQHGPRCLAMDARVRTFMYEHRRFADAD